MKSATGSSPPWTRSNQSAIHPGSRPRRTGAGSVFGAVAEIGAHQIERLCFGHATGHRLDQDVGRGVSGRLKEAQRIGGYGSGGTRGYIRWGRWSEQGSQPGRVSFGKTQTIDNLGLPRRSDGSEQGGELQQQLAAVLELFRQRSNKGRRARGESAQDVFKRQNRPQRGLSSAPCHAAPQIGRHAKAGRDRPEMRSRTQPPTR